MNRLITILSCYIKVICLFSRDIYLPSLPAIAASLSASHSMIMFSLTACLLGDGLSQMIYGPLSDAYGRRIIFLFGITLAMLGNALTCVSTTGAMFVLCRFITGLGTGCCPVITRAIARDIYKQQELTKSFSYFSMIAAASPIVAPIIGGLLQYYFDWRINFIFLIMMTMTCWIGLYGWIPETIKSKNVKFNFRQILSIYYKLISHNRAMSYALISGISFSFTIAYFMFSPFLFQTILHLSSKENGLLYSIIAFGFISGAYCAAKISVKISDDYIIMIGITLCIISCLLFLLSYVLNNFTVNSIIVDVMFCIMGCGLITPIANKNVLEPFPESAGQAAAFLGVIRMLVAFLMGLFVSHLWIHNGLQIAFIFGILCGAHVLTYFIFWLRAG